jgi:hypothetical protein
MSFSLRTDNWLRFVIFGLQAPEAGGKMRSVAFYELPIWGDWFGNWVQFSRCAPKVCGHSERVDPLRAPPSAFVAAPVKLTMVQPADRDGELVADLSTHRALLCKFDVMGIRWGPSAKKARLRSDKPQVVSIAFSDRLADDGNLFFARTILPRLTRTIADNLAPRRYLEWLDLV